MVEQAFVDWSWGHAVEFLDSATWGVPEAEISGATVWRRPPSAGKEGCARPIKIEGVICNANAHFVLALLCDTSFKIEHDDGTRSVDVVHSTTVEIPGTVSASASSAGQPLQRKVLVPAAVKHEITDYPFPLARRDKVYLQVTGWLPDSRRLLALECSIDHPMAPALARGTVRAQVFSGFTLQQRGQDVGWQIFAEADPGGFIPSWVVDRRCRSIAGWVARMNRLFAPGGRCDGFAEWLRWWFNWLRLCMMNVHAGCAATACSGGGRAVGAASWRGFVGRTGAKLGQSLGPPPFAAAAAAAAAEASPIGRCPERQGSGRWWNGGSRDSCRQRWRPLDGG